MASTAEKIVDGIGFCGGGLVASALVPQIYRIYKRKGARDLSFVWQGVYIVGLSLIMIYQEHFGLWPVFVPVAFELICIIFLTSLKIHFDVLAPRKRAAAAALAAARVPTPTISPMTTPGGGREGGVRRASHESV